MDEILIERRGQVLVVTLNRPDALNAIDASLADSLLASFRELDADPDLAVGVVHGAGRGFSAGMDLKAFLTHGSPKSLEELVQVGARKPLVAAVEGFALAGGLEIVLTCDLIVAARGARFGIPEVKVGLFAAAGGLIRLPQRLSPAVATEMALTGAPIDAERAFELGLVNRLSEPGDALEEAVRLADTIAANAPLAVQASKEMLRASSGITDAEFWALQAPVFDRVFASSDAREGPAAFAEKRPPSWTGR